MTSIIDNWLSGIEYIITDDLISFYTFFTILFAEIAYSWANFPITKAIFFTIILLAYILNVIVSASLKGAYEGSKKEKKYSICYIVTFVIIFLVGCCNSILYSAVFLAIPLAVTWLWIRIRNYQDSMFLEPTFISKLFTNKIFWLFSQFVVIGGPFVALIVCFAIIPNMPLPLKIIFPAIYLLIAPLIPSYEDESATCNIFEMAYDITWSDESEE